MKKLFGTDGVRGKAGELLSAELIMRLAMAAGIYFRKSSVTNLILVGKDTRRSGYMIETAIVSGLTSIGFNVRQIGPMPTPAIAFLTEDMRCDGGIMISASHNPYYDNGVKFFDKFGFKLDESEEEKIEKIFYNDELINSAKCINMEIGAAKRVDDVIGRYIVHIKNSFPKSMTLHGLRVVLDVANGASYKVAPTIFSELGAEVFILNNEPNGKNINDNCGALHPQSLGQEVRNLRADVGFAFDGDADRLVVVDNFGDVIDGDVLMGVLALFLKNEGKLKNNKIATTIMSNKALDDFLNKFGIKTLRGNVGDKFVLELLREHDLSFGGEQSGHLIFSDYAKTGDGIASALQFSACMLKSKKTSSELGKVFKPYPQLLRNIKIKNKPPIEELAGFKELEEKLNLQGYRSLFRYSGTENVIRLLLEGKDSNKIEAAMDEVESFFQKALNG